jgi:hypothetical protein
MYKLWAYAIPKYEFRYWPCMGPTHFFSEGVDITVHTVLLASTPT